MTTTTDGYHVIYTGWPSMDARLCPNLAVLLQPTNRAHGWLFAKHPDGQWVTIANLKPVAAAISMPSPAPATLGVSRGLEDVVLERQRQCTKGYDDFHDDQHTVPEFVQTIEDYAGWARQMDCMGSPSKARHRLVQVAALAIAAVESIDRKSGA